jgi:PAS domain S-box-containing protein
MSSSRNENPSGHMMSRDELETLVRDRTAEISRINHKLNQKTSEIERLKAATGFTENNYMAVFELSHDAIIILRPDTEIILDVNSKACDLYNVKREEFVGISFKYFSKNVPQGEKEIRETIRKGSNQFESVHYKKNGEEMLMHVNATVINYDGQKAIMAMNSEITDKVFQVV